MKHRLMTATAIAVSLPLGGCAGLFNFGAPKSASVAQERSVIDMSEYFQRLLVEGHGHLKAGRLSKAEIAFRQASRDASTEAAALNGLAITYDRLGRTDLAERYFKQAVASAEPDDFRYARNLARFEGKQLRRKMDREAAQEARLAQRKAPAPVERIAKASAVEVSTQQSFEEAFADLAQDAPLASRPAGSPAKNHPVKTVPAAVIAAAPAQAPAPRPVITVGERFESPAPAVQVGAAAPRIRTTGRLVAPNQATASTRSAGIRIESRQVGLVRVSKGEVRIGTPSYSAQANIPVSAPNPSPPEQTDEVESGDQNELPGTGLSDASQVHNERTPLALVDAWTSIQAGS